MPLLSFLYSSQLLSPWYRLSYFTTQLPTMFLFCFGMSAFICLSNSWVYPGYQNLSTRVTTRVLWKAAAFSAPRIQEPGAKSNPVTTHALTASIAREHTTGYQQGPSTTRDRVSDEQGLGASQKTAGEETGYSVSLRVSAGGKSTVQFCIAEAYLKRNI